MLATVQTNVALVNFIQHIISSYFIRENFGTVIYYDRNLTDPKAFCDQSCDFLHSLESAFTAINEQHSVMWITADEYSDEKLESSIEKGCQSYILVTKNVMSFLEMKLMVKENTLQRIRDRNILVFIENKPVFDKNWIIREAMKFYPNLWFMVPSGPNSYNFYTHDYAINNATDVRSIRSYNLSSDVFQNWGSIFYDKLFDLGGRTIPMGATEYVPYCTTTNVGENNGNTDAVDSTASKELYLEGLEGSLIVEFCRNRNCNIQLWPSGPNEWGDIWANGSGFGEIYGTYSKKTEFSICCLYYNWHLHLLDGSQYVAKSTITALVPGATILPTSLTVIYPFSKMLWLSVFIMLIIMTGIHHLITALNSVHSMESDLVQPPIEKSIFDMISIYLDQGIFPNSFSSSYRILISFILLSGVVLSNSYASGLASVLTVPRYGKSIETIHDFVQTPYRWGAPAIAWVLSLFGADSHDIQIVVDKFDIVPNDEQLYRRSLTGEYGVGVELLNGGSYAFGPFIREDNVRSFDILKEEFYFTYTIGYAQRGWPLMEYFNKFNLEAIQCGFVIYWEKRTLRRYASSRVQQALQEIAAGHNEGEEIAPLSTQHIVGPMIVLGIGLSLALAVFVMEFIVFALMSHFGCLKRRKPNQSGTRAGKAPKRF